MAAAVTDNTLIADVAIIVPQLEEYKAIKQVFSVPSMVATELLPPGGTYQISKIPIVFPSQSFLRVAIGCMDDMYNYPCLALTERLLLYIKPQLIFLVGSACGNIRKVAVGDIVVTTTQVAYLGRGRRQGQTVNPRPYTESIPAKMKDAIRNYMMYQARDFKRWNIRCRMLLKEICKEDSLPDGFSRRSTFEIKSGIIASDDLVPNQASL